MEMEVFDDYMEVLWLQLQVIIYNIVEVTTSHDAVRAAKPSSALFVAGFGGGSTKNT